MGEANLLSLCLCAASAHPGSLDAALFPVFKDHDSGVSDVTFIRGIQLVTSLGFRFDRNHEWRSDPFVELDCSPKPQSLASH